MVITLCFALGNMHVVLGAFILVMCMGALLRVVTHFTMPTRYINIHELKKKKQQCKAYQFNLFLIHQIAMYPTTIYG